MFKLLVHSLIVAGVIACASINVSSTIRADEPVYRADLDRHPNNAWSLLGLQQSLGLQGKSQAAEDLNESVQQAWARADVKPIASCYCHPDALLRP